MRNWFAPDGPRSTFTAWERRMYCVEILQSSYVSGLCAANKVLIRLPGGCGVARPKTSCLELWESYSLHRLSPDQGIIFSFLFHFVFHFFSCFISFSDHVKFSFSFFFHSPIMRKCHSHLFMVFPSCAVNSIMCILVPSRLVDTQRKTSKSKTQKLRPQPQFLWGRNSRLLQVRIRLTLIVN